MNAEITYVDYIKIMRLLGEMAGALEVVSIVKPKDINVAGVNAILKRYQEMFEESK